MNTNPWITDDTTNRESDNSDDRGKEEQRNGSPPDDSYARQYDATRDKPASDSPSPNKPQNPTSFHEEFSRKRDSHRSESQAPHQEQEEDESAGTGTETREPETTHNAVSTPQGELRKSLEAQRNTTPEDQLPHLSKGAHRRLNQNSREFSLIEGNLREMDRSMQVIYLTSCFEKEGKSTTVTSTAYGLAEFSDCNVLLVDSNYDSPQLHKLFGVSLSPGLQEILHNSPPPEEAIIPTAYKQLYLLPAGESGSSILTEGLEDLLRLFRANFDFILIDGKTLLASSEVSNLAPFMDGFILVVECEKTKWEVVDMAKHKLDNAGAAQTGILLNQRQYYLPEFIYRLISKG